MLRVIGAVLLLTLAGCEEDPHPPGAPGVDGGMVMRPPIGTRRDGGMAGDADIDGAAFDAGPEPTCVVVPPDDLDNRATVVLSGAVLPFTVTRVFAVHNASSCDDPDILVVLTDGACTVGAGEQLLFFLRVADIGTLLRPGPNVLGPEISDSLHVLYLRPAVDGDGADQTWGDCLGASGEVTFSEIDSLPGAPLRATFDLSLSDCDDPAVDANVVIRGAFEVALGTDLDEVCPPAP